MPEPRVSVIVPCYNVASSVGDAVRSVLAQTYPGFEIIIVNDGSTDNTAEVIQAFLIDPRIRYVEQANLGSAGARNAGVRVSSREFVAFLDADDLFAPKALELMISAVDAAHASWCVTATLLIRGTLREVCSPVMPDDLVKGILRRDFITRSPLFRREDFLALGMFDEEILVREDWELNIRAILRGLPFADVDEPVYVYRLRDSGISRNVPKMLFYTNRVLKKHHKVLADAGDREAARIYAENLWDLARRWAYTRHHYARALFCALQCFAYERSLMRVVRMFTNRRLQFTGCSTSVEDDTGRK